MSSMELCQTVLITYSLIVLGFVFIPGPATLLTVARATTSGTRVGIATGAGITAGDIIHTVMAVVGISAIIAASATQSALRTTRSRSGCDVIAAAWAATYPDGPRPDGPRAAPRSAPVATAFPKKRRIWLSDLRIVLKDRVFGRGVFRIENRLIAECSRTGGLTRFKRKSVGALFLKP